MTKRALSLNDIVNHDEDEPSVKQANLMKPNEGTTTAEASQLDSEDTDTDDNIDMQGNVKFSDAAVEFDYDKDTKAQNTTLSDASSKKIPQEFDLATLDENPGRTAKSIEINSQAEIKAKAQPKLKSRKSEKDNKLNAIFKEKTSLQSKKHNIKRDLQVLNEISSVSKPGKYDKTPIWATKWRPTIKALQSIDIKDFKIDSSFLGIIPDDDVTKSVQDWIYATIYSIAPDLRQHIELEMKFGILLDSRTPDRVNPPVSSQCVFTEMDAHLRPNIEESVFNELQKYIKGVSDLNENANKFSIIESHTRDSMYRVGLTTQRPRFLRMSTDMKTGRIAEFIEKRNVAQLMLFSPKDSYDVKISLNLELPLMENDPPEKYISNHKPISERTKNRMSYIHNDSCTRIDITKVHNSNKNTKSNDAEITHEVELEISTPALLSAFNNINADSKEYASIIRTFLNNGTIIRRKLTSLSYEIFEGQKKV